MNLSNLKKKDGFAAIIGLVLSLVIVSILLTLSLSSFSSRQRIGNTLPENIINKTKERLENYSQQQQLMIQKQLEEITNNSGGNVK